MTLLGLAITSFSSGLGEGLVLKPPEQCLATEFKFVFTGAFLGDSSSKPLEISPVISTARVCCAGGWYGRSWWLGEPCGL